MTDSLYQKIQDRFMVSRLSDHRRAEAEKNLNQARRIRNVLATESGRLVLEDLVDLFTPPLGARFQPGEDSTDAAFRDGAAAVINFIQAQIALAEQSGAKLKSPEK